MRKSISIVDSPDVTAGQNSIKMRIWSSNPGTDPETVRFRRKSHLVFLVISCLVVTLAWMLTVLDSDNVSFRGGETYPLPVLCPSRAFFGWNCLGCGLTRSVIFFAQGEWERSWVVHRLGGVFLILIVAQIPYRVWCLSQPAGGPKFSMAAENMFWGTLIAALFLNGLLR